MTDDTKKSNKPNFHFSKETDSIKGDTFSAMYPVINHHVLSFLDNKIDSRNGDTSEVLAFKTTITDPYKRCVGGYQRDVNIFFLLAEAMWIFCGKRDVAYLKLFNNRMGEYSDDGEFFHAPYGWRMRRQGVPSEIKIDASSIHSAQGMDQIEKVVELLSLDKNVRRAVVSIWDAEFDLGVVSKDLPCNDMLFLKVRDGKLYSTISNRSNDLHWGLPTNVFQFSFLTELISLCLGVELGQQTHNSDSLHVYLANQICWTMFENKNMNSHTQDLYEKSIAKPIDMDFDLFTTELSDHPEPLRLGIITNILNRIIVVTTNTEEIYNQYKKDGLICKDDEAMIYEKSKYMACVMRLLFVYLVYKRKGSSESSKREAIVMLNDIIADEKYAMFWNCDFMVLSYNFFVSRLKDKFSEENMDSLDLQKYEGFNLGNF